MFQGFPMNLQLVLWVVKVWIMVSGVPVDFMGLFTFYGLFYFLPFSNAITKTAGIVSLIISLVIVYQHVYAWGDNIFAYGPFKILNIEEGKKSIFGQFLFIPISIYIIFSSRPNYNIINDAK